MIVKMLKSVYGSDEDECGVNTGPSLYAEGKAYEVGESLGNNLIASGAAVLDSPVLQSETYDVDSVKPAKRSKKNLGRAPENK